MDSIEGSYGTYYFKNEILYFKYAPRVKITLEMTKAMLADRKKLLEDKVAQVLISDNGFKGLDKNARDFLSTAEAQSGISAAAFLVTSEFNRLVTNFFIKVNVLTVQIPFMVFTDEQEALLWLKSIQ